MTRFVAGRLFQATLVVLAVATLTFVLLQLAPGDPQLPGDAGRYMSPEQLEQARRNAGLDRPLHVQYLSYLGRLVRGDLGMSILQQRPVRDVIQEAIPNTLLLAFAAWLIDFSIGITLGVSQGRKPGSAFDRIASSVTLTLYSTPVFVIGLVLMLVFALKLGWLPVAGARDALSSLYPTSQKILDRLHHLVLPALTLGLVGGAATTRYQRAAVIEVIRQDFIRTARAKGLPERAVLLRHALRNALLPIVTLMGISLPALLSGAVLVESVFGFPGLGDLSSRAIFSRDYQVVTGAAILAAICVVVGNLLADLACHLADPRTRVGSTP